MSSISGGLFGRAMKLQISHDYFTVWMVTRSRDLAGVRSVETLSAAPAALVSALEAFRLQ